MRAVVAGSGVGASVHDARVEGTGTAAERVERKGGSDVGGVGERVGFEKRETEKSEHALRAVEKRETFFGFESDRRDAGALHGVGAGESFGVVDSAGLRR